MKQNTSNSPVCSSLIFLFQMDRKVGFLQEEQEIICLSFVLCKDPVSHPGERERLLRVSYIKRISGQMSEKPV